MADVEIVRGQLAIGLEVPMTLIVAPKEKV
jgi:hypothetical protein